MYIGLSDSQQCGFPVSFPFNDNIIKWILNLLKLVAMEFYNFQIKHKLIKQQWESSKQTAANNGKERGIEKK